MYHLFFLDYFMLPDMVVSGNVTCAALQQAAASGEVDHDLWGREHGWTSTSDNDLWGRELTYISGKMPDKLLFQGAPEAAVYPAYYRCFKALLERQLIFMRHNAVNNL